MIPPEKSAAVTRGLTEAFGATELEEIRQLPSGLSSALVFRVVVRGSPYLLRIITRTDAIGDPTRQFTYMHAAAGAGITPRVWYTSIEDRISITDFVTAMPLPVSEALVRMPAILRTLHALPPFAEALNYRTMNKGFIRRFRDANIFPPFEIEKAFARYSQLADVYPQHDPDMVCSHDDLKPDNIVFDGQRVWLVNWEAAFRNDRYFDLSIVANFVVASDAR